MGAFTLFIMALVWTAVLLPLAPQAAATAVNESVDHGWTHLVSAPQNLTVNMTSQTYDPQDIAVQVGENLTLTIRNNDTQSHTFTVYSQANTTIPRNDTPAELSALFAQPGSSLVNLSLAPGANATWNVTFPTAVSYEVVSLVPYQFQAGYYGYINATVPVKVTQFNVSAFDSLTFVPNTLSAPTGSTVDFSVTEEGHGHTFTLDGCSNDSQVVVGVALPTSDSCLTNGTITNLNLGSTVGAVINSGPITLPSKAGTYWFVCTVPGHFAAGMYGHLYDGTTPVPPTSLPTETSVIQLGILAVAAVAVGLSALLVLMGSSGDRPKVSSPAIPPPK